MPSNSPDAATDGEGMPTEREWLEGLPEDRDAATERVCLTERECRQWIDTLRRPPWDVRRKHTIERVALEMERAVEAALDCNLVLRGFGG